MSRYKVETFCDFGTPGRRTSLGKHKNFSTAVRQYARIWKVYHRFLNRHYCVWQEEIIAQAEGRTP